jgi:hypothetical protein
MRQPFLTIETLCLEAPIPKHLGHLSVLLSILFEHQLALIIIVFVLSPSPIFSSLAVSSLSTGQAQNHTDRIPFLYSTRKKTTINRSVSQIS